MPEQDPFHVGRIVRRTVEDGDEETEQYGRIVSLSPPSGVNVAWDSTELKESDVAAWAGIEGLIATGWISGAPGGAQQQQLAEVDAGRAAAEKAARDAQAKVREGQELLNTANTRINELDRALLASQQQAREADAQRMSLGEYSRSLETKYETEVVRHHRTEAQRAEAVAKLAASEQQVREQSASLLEQRTQIETLMAEAHAQAVVDHAECQEKLNVAYAERDDLETLLAGTRNALESARESGGNAEARRAEAQARRDAREEEDRASYKHRYEAEVRANTDLRRRVEEAVKGAERAREAHREAEQRHLGVADGLREANDELRTLLELAQGEAAGLRNEMAEYDPPKPVTVNIVLGEGVSARAARAAVEAAKS